MTSAATIKSACAASRKRSVDSLTAGMEQAGAGAITPGARPF